MLASQKIAKNVWDEGQINQSTWYSKNQVIKEDSEIYFGGLFFINNSIVDMSFKGVDVKSLEKISLFPDDEFYYNNMNENYLVINKLVEEFKPEQYLVSKFDFEIIKKIYYKGYIKLFTQFNDFLSISEGTIFFL